MANSSQSSAEREKGSLKAQRLWSSLVVLAALAVIAVMVYPFIASRQNLPLPSAEETSVNVSERMAAVSPADRAKLAHELFQHPNPLVRLATVDAIYEWKVREALPLLERSLEDNCSAVRRRGMETLWKRDRERGMRLLLAGLKDEDVDIRRGAITQLRFVNDKRTVPAVISLLDDEDPTVRFLAQGVLRKLTGLPYFARVADPPEKHQAVIRQWKQWWAKQAHQWEDEKRWAQAQPSPPARVDPAPDFRLRTIDGARTRLGDYRGRMLVLHFYGTWCAPCEKEMPELVRLRQAFAESQVAMLGVAVGETQKDKAVREWVQKFKISFPQALATPEIVAAYWVQGVPITYLIDAQGNIRYRWEGERDFESFRRTIARLLQSQSP
jgi:peroxiredoxin